MAYMIALNVIERFGSRSATNKDPDFCHQADVRRFSRSCDRYRSFTDRLPQNIKSDCHYLPFMCSQSGAVLIWGRSVNNAKRWIEVPVLGQLQPSEFVKLV